MVFVAMFQNLVAVGENPSLGLLLESFLRVSMAFVRGGQGGVNQVFLGFTLLFILMTPGDSL